MTASAQQNAPARRRIWLAMQRALPSLAAALLGAIGWAVAMGGSALFNLLMDGWQTPGKIRFMALLFAAGGALAFPVGLFFARLFSMGKSRETAFAAAFVCLLVCTIAFTSGLFSLQYRLYYAEWHAPAFSIMWILQFVFTVAASLYQFAVLGIRLYFPIGLLALFAASLWFARQPR